MKLRSRTSGIAAMGAVVIALAGCSAGSPKAAPATPISRQVVTILKALPYESDAQLTASAHRLKSLTPAAMPLAQALDTVVSDGTHWSKVTIDDGAVQADADALCQQLGVPAPWV